MLYAAFVVVFLILWSVIYAVLPASPHISKIVADATTRASVRWARIGRLTDRFGAYVPVALIVIAGGVSGPQEFLILDQPGAGRSIWTTGDRVPAIGSPISDSHGVWFGSPDGIFLYSGTHGVQKVSNQPGYPANGCF